MAVFPSFIARVASIGSFRKPHESNTQLRAFTLPELLIAILVASVITVSLGLLLINQMKFSTQIESVQRNEEDINRFNYLLSVETGESQSVQLQPVPPATTPELSMGTGCRDASVKPLFALVIPRNDTNQEYSSSANAVKIYYYNLNGNIMRCAPPVNRYGQLLYTGSLMTGIAIRDAIIELNGDSSSCGGEVSSAQQIVYNLKLSGKSPRDSGSCVIARPKTVRVGN